MTRADFLRWLRQMDIDPDTCIHLEWTPYTVSRSSGAPVYLRATVLKRNEDGTSYRDENGDLAIEVRLVRMECPE
jgi:hypothetical protein